MPPLPPSRQRPHEGGQLFAGWVVGIFIIAAMIIYATDALRRERTTTQSMIYRELALNVAKDGFEEGLSFFRTHTNGCFLNSAQAPSNQLWLTPWPAYPDSAFQPQSKDTDFYSNITVTTPTGGLCAGGIIGDVPMDQFVTVTPAEDMNGSTLWGRYVIRRQNVANWSPGPDTATVNTDPDACHDLSSITSQSALGAGTHWSIASRGYLVRLPAPLTTTSVVGSLLGDPAAFTAGNLLSAPLAYYNNQPFLLAQARVYGELSRINFNFPDTTVLVPYVSGTNSATSPLTINTNGILNATGAIAAYSDSAGTAMTVAGSCPSACFTGSQFSSTPWTPSIANCFPGQTWTSLQSIATALGPNGTPIAGFVGNSSILPVYGSAGYPTQVSHYAFYFLNQDTTLAPGNNPALSGVGLCVVDGSLDIQTGSYSNWAGVLYVKGQVTLDGPSSVTGIIISETGISIGNATDLNKTTVAYDANIITLVQGMLQDFVVDSSSIVANQF